MHSLLKTKKNVKLLLDAGGMKILIDLVTLAHLHTTRATTPFQVVINGAKIYFLLNRIFLRLFHVSSNLVLKGYFIFSKMFLKVGQCITNVIVWCIISMKSISDLFWTISLKIIDFLKYHDVIMSSILNISSSGTNWLYLQLLIIKTTVIML